MTRATDCTQNFAVYSSAVSLNGPLPRHHIIKKLWLTLAVHECGGAGPSCRGASRSTWGCCGGRYSLPKQTLSIPSWTQHGWRCVWWRWRRSAQPRWAQTWLEHRMGVGMYVQGFRSCPLTLHTYRTGRDAATIAILALSPSNITYSFTYFTQYHYLNTSKYGRCHTLS